MKRLIQRALVLIPAVRRYVGRKNGMISALQAERDALLRERDSQLAERDALAAERDARQAERNAMATQVEALGAETARLATQLAARTTSNANLALERDRLRLRLRALAAGPSGERVSAAVDGPGDDPPGHGGVPWVLVNMLVAERDAAIRGGLEWLDRQAAEQRVADLVLPVRTVLDIGPGIRPMSYFKPVEHICVEPYHEYAMELKAMQSGRPEIRIVERTVPDSLFDFERQSIDSIFMLDVLEHLPRDQGTQAIAECERIARSQIVIFTPFGFMPQHYEPGEPDAWGMHGTEYQTHLSGWTPMDFGAGWTIVACKDFHTTNSKDEVQEVPFGAFWAIKTIG